MKKTGFDITPKPAALRALKNERWTATGAVAELVDNAFGSKRGDAANFWIECDQKANTLTVLDDGRGMEEIGLLFRLGDSIGFSPKDIGIYGAGGTKAILWLADIVEIWTLRGGKVQSDKVVWQRDVFDAEEFPKVSDTWVKATLSNTPPQLLDVRHGTLIRLTLTPGRLFKGRAMQSNLKRDLSRLYSSGIRQDRSIFWNGERLADPYGRVSKDAEVLDFTIGDKAGEGLNAEGRAIYSESTTPDESQFRIGFGYRTVLTTRDCYQESEEGGRKYSGLHVSGYLDLGEGWQDNLTTTKDEFKDNDLRNDLMDQIFYNIEPWLQKSKQLSTAVVFEGLRFQLTAALNRHGQRVKVAVTINHEERELGDGQGTHTHSDEPEPRGGLERVAADPEGVLHLPATVDIVSSNQDALGLILCKAEIVGAHTANITVRVAVNTDHYLIKNALEGKPTNRDVFNTTIVSELSAVLALDENQILLPRLFIDRKLGRELAGLVDFDERRRRIQFELMNRVREAA